MLNSVDIDRIDQIRTSARQIVRALGFMQNNLAGTNLSPSAVHTILELGYGTISNATELAALLHLEKSSISRLLKKLQADGLVQIIPCPTDGRARTLALSGKGKTMLAQIEEFAKEQLHQALDPLNRDTLGDIQIGLRDFANALGGGQSACDTLDIREGYQTGLIAQVSALHAGFYADHYGFGAHFERKVASELSEFIGRIDAPMNAVFSAFSDGVFVGSISVDGQDLGPSIGHIRWFIVDPMAQGKGVGRALIAKAMGFTTAQHFKETRLWTFKGLDAARQLYERSGFRLYSEKLGRQWGTEVTEQEFVHFRAT